MILIIGDNQEYHSQFIYNELQKRGYKTAYFDSRKYPYDILLSYTPQDDDGFIKIGNEKILIKDIQGVYWRWFHGINYEQLEDEFVSEMVYRERSSCLFSFFQSLKANWCNSYYAIELHKTKVYQLDLMKQNGIRIPKTLITNDSDAFVEFWEKNNKNIIAKPVLGGAFTKKITPEDLSPEYLKTVKTSPIQLQECVEGVDIRTYAFENGNVFPAVIKANTIDFRADEEAIPVPCEIPLNIQKDCLKILDILGLTYSGIDIRKTSNGEYVFIEANPAPMFTYFEEVTKYPITDNLIELLVK